MMSVTGGMVCLATLATASAFVAPLAVRYGAPLASSASKAGLRMSAEGAGDDMPLVFPRSSLHSSKCYLLNCMCMYIVTTGKDSNLN